MAKRQTEQDPAPEKAKVRVFFAEVEGNNESVKEALKTMVAAMGRPVQVISPQRAPGNGSTHATLGNQVEPPADAEETIEADEGQSTEVADASAAESTRKPRGTSGTKRDYNAGIELVHDLDFRPEGKESLKDFFAAKTPKNDQEMILVLTYYMQHTLGHSSIGLGHIRTAFKDVEKPLPVDLRTTIRNMRKHKAWLQFTDLESIRVSTVGENVVEHDLGKGE